MSAARILLPKEAKRGEVIEVRLVVQHPMETGFRRDAQGQRIPRNAIHSLACRYGGTEVFRATLSTGIAANPFVRFFMRVERSAELELWWLDDDEVEGSSSAALTVV